MNDFAGSRPTNNQDVVDQLKNALDVAEQEKCQAAQYGMRLLEDKEMLQHELDESHKLIEGLRHELNLTTEKLKEQSLIQRRISRAGFEEHEDSLSKSVNRERELTDKVHDLEIELKESKVKYDSLTNECDAAYQKCADLQTKYEEHDKTGLKLRDDVKRHEAKLNQLNCENEDLLAENVDLQKTILTLKTNLTEFESIRHDHRRLQHDNEMIHAQLEEITKLKRITEKSLEEALESLQIERDQRHNLRRELDSRIRLESLQQYVTLHNDLKSATEWNLDGNSDQQTDVDKVLLDASSRDQPVEARSLDKSLAAAELALSHKEDKLPLNDLSSSTDHQPPTTASSVRTGESDSSSTTVPPDLYARLEATQRSLELASSEAASKQERINALLAQLDVIMSVKSEADAELDSSASTEETSLAKSLRQAENRYSVALRQIASLQHELWRLRRGHEQLDEDEDGLKSELLDLQVKLDKGDERLKELTSQSESSREAVKHWESTANRLACDLDKGLALLVRVYALACGAIDETPSKQIIDLANRLQINLSEVTLLDSGLDSATDDASSIASSCDTANPDTAAGAQPGEIDFSGLANPWTNCGLVGGVDSHLSLASLLRQSINTLIGRYNQLTSQHDGQNSSELEHYQQQNLKLSEELQRKRDQLNTLRITMRASRVNAELALEGLKQKHEDESIQNRQQIHNLHLQMKELKENEATHSSLSAVFTQRYHNLTVELNELQRKLTLVEDEKASLKSLLYAAVRQKLVLTQKLEAYDIAREEQRNQVYRQHQQTAANAQTDRHRHPGGGGGSHNTSPHNNIHPSRSCQQPNNTASPCSPSNGGTPGHYQLAKNGPVTNSSFSPPPSALTTTNYSRPTNTGQNKKTIRPRRENNNNKT